LLPCYCDRALPLHIIPFVREGDGIIGKCGANYNPVLTVWLSAVSRRQLEEIRIHTGSCNVKILTTKQDGHFVRWPVPLQRMVLELSPIESSLVVC
jgi:hypothetical protein